MQSDQAGLDPLSLLIMCVLTIYPLKVMQSTALVQEHFDLWSFSPLQPHAPCPLSPSPHFVTFGYYLTYHGKAFCKTIVSDNFGSKR